MTPIFALYLIFTINDGSQKEIRLNNIYHSRQDCENVASATVVKYGDMSEIKAMVFVTDCREVLK